MHRPPPGISCTQTILDIMYSILYLSTYCLAKYSIILDVLPFYLGMIADVLPSGGGEVQLALADALVQPVLCAQERQRARQEDM